MHDDDSKLFPDSADCETDDLSRDDLGREDEPFYFEELDFELELALERFGTLKSADRILRSPAGLPGAAALIVRRYQPVH